MGRGVLMGVLMGVLVLAWTGSARAATDPPEPGTTTSGTYDHDGDSYSFVSYVPKSLPAGKKVPLVVMIHGAQTTALQELHATGYDLLAERDGFIVLYPDVDAFDRSAPGPIAQSWKFYDPTVYFRGTGDSAAIAGMTRAAMATLPVDPDRVYAVGVSVGGLMTGVMAAAYPDLFAATGIVESSAYADAACFVTGTGIPVQTSAQLAFAQMDTRARVVPTMVMTSDADQAFPRQCGEKALEQGLRTNNLVLGGTQTAPLSLTPASVTGEQVPGGYKYDVSTYRDPAGCVVAEQYLIHGMPHAWPGGPTVDPKYTGYTDNKAPSGADATWGFVSRYTKSSTAPPCSEAPAASRPPPPPPPAAAVERCPARTLTYALPAHARGVRVTVDGHRVRFRVTGRRVRVRRAATTRTRTAIVVRGRTATGEAFVRRYSYRECA